MHHQLYLDIIQLISELGNLESASYICIIQVYIAGVSVNRSIFTLSRARAQHFCRFSVKNIRSMLEFCGVMQIITFVFV